MKKLGTLAVLLSLGLFTLGCAGTEGDAANGNGNGDAATESAEPAATDTADEGGEATEEAPTE